MPARLKPLTGICQCQRQSNRSIFPLRPFSTTSAPKEEAQVKAASPNSRRPLDPNTALGPRNERLLQRAGLALIGSRRRRAALRGAKNIPFEQLPYQAFQEARNILLEDRQEKIKQIETQRGRIERLKASTPKTPNQEFGKQRSLLEMQKHLEELKIHADINDPLVKKRFEDGLGDMNKPIYRYLANRKWRERRRPIIVQRITQMSVTPDVLDSMDPVADVSLYFGRSQTMPGEFIPSLVSARGPRLDVRVFDKGERLVSIAVVDADVPNMETDNFDQRLHCLAVNVPLSPTLSSINLGAEKLPAGDTVVGWRPPYSQKGAPYHRLAIFIMQQPTGHVIPADALRTPQKGGTYNASGELAQKFSLRSFVNKHKVTPVGVTMFRTKWDEGMDELMTRLKLPGVGVELKRKRVYPLPYKWKPSSGEKYRAG